VVVLAAGVWSPELLASSNGAANDETRLPIEPVRGQILSLESPLPAMQSIGWAPGIYFVPKRDGSWVVGATQERVGFDRRVTAAGIAGLLGDAIRVFPCLGDATLVRTWAGLRPVSADGLPAVGRMPGWEGLYVAAGHGRNGVLLAPITARLLADLLLGKTTAIGAEGWLEPGRFGPGTSRPSRV
jgi:glycine oxidase